VVTEDFDINPCGEHNFYDARVNGSAIWTVSLIRDDLGRIEMKTETVQGQTHVYDYDYDVDGRLYQVWKDSGVVETYAYDVNGARIDPATGLADVDAQDRLRRWGDTTYTYTDHGTLASRLDTLTGDVTTYSHDAFGQLRQVVLPDATVIDYGVDALGRRISRRVDGVITHRYPKHWSGKETWCQAVAGWVENSSLPD